MRVATPPRQVNSLQQGDEEHPAALNLRLSIGLSKPLLGTLPQGLAEVQSIFRLGFALLNSMFQKPLEDRGKQTCNW